MKQKEIFIERFNGVNEFVNVIGKRTPNSVFAGKDLSSDTHGKEFTMTNNYAESVELMTKGYADGLAQMKAAKSVKVHTASNAHKRIPQASVVGYAPHVPNAIAGVPQSMIGSQKIEQKAKVISIIYNGSGNCSVNTEDFVRAGRNLLEVVTILELQGYRVGIEIMDDFCSDKQIGFCSIKVKEQRQPLNPLKLAYMLIHPSFFRRQGFRWLETSPRITDMAFYFGHGHALYTDCDRNITKEREFLKKNGLLPDGVFFTNLYEARKHTAEELIKLMGIQK